MARRKRKVHDAHGRLTRAAEEIIEQWNTAMHSLPAVKSVVPSRISPGSKRAVNLERRLADDRFRKEFAQVCETIRNNAFLRGDVADRHGERWSVTFDWIVRKDPDGALNYVRVLDGEFERWDDAGPVLHFPGRDEGPPNRLLSDDERRELRRTIETLRHQ